MRTAARGEGETWLKRRTAGTVLSADAQLGSGRAAARHRRFPAHEPARGGCAAEVAGTASFHEGVVRLGGLPDPRRCRTIAHRARTGETKWNYWKLWNLAIEGFTSFSVLPLKIATYVGAAVALLAALFGVVVVVRTLVSGGSPAGYPSLLVVVLLLGGVQLMFLGVIGEYLGRVFNETKQRPLYLVEEFAPSLLPSPAARERVG